MMRRLRGLLSSPAPIQAPVEDFLQAHAVGVYKERFSEVYVMRCLETLGWHYDDRGHMEFRFCQTPLADGEERCPRCTTMLAGEAEMARWAQERQAAERELIAKGEIECPYGCTAYYLDPHAPKCPAA